LEPNPVQEIEPKRACSGALTSPRLHPAPAAAATHTNECSQSSPKAPSFGGSSLLPAEPEHLHDAHSSIEGIHSLLMPPSTAFIPHHANSCHRPQIALVLNPNSTGPLQAAAAAATCLLECWRQYQVPPLGRTLLFLSSAAPPPPSQSLKPPPTRRVAAGSWCLSPITQLSLPHTSHRIAILSLL
jgi:hypothetical protein